MARVNLYRPDVDGSTVDNLVSGTLIPLKLLDVTLADGSGIVKRGTPLTSTNGVTYMPISGSSEEIKCILFNDVDVANEFERGSAAAAFSGEFNQNVIEEVMGAGLTPLQLADAKDKQIFVRPQNPAPTIDGSEALGGGS